MKKLSKKQKLIILISIITLIVILGLIIGANVIRTNIANNSYESSNSGSNNGNLLPEYIKKGITLGGVTGTLESLDTSDATATAEDIAWGKTAYVKGEKITGTYLTLGMLEKGDYVAMPNPTRGSSTVIAEDTGYSSDQSYTISSTNNQLNWRILGSDENGVKLIADTNLQSNETNGTLTLYGAQGYVTGCSVFNQICDELYGSLSYVNEARSVKIEDINQFFGLDEVDIKKMNIIANEYVSNIGDNINYRGWTPESYLAGEAESNITLNSSMYGYLKPQESAIGDFLFNDSYWIASRGEYRITQNNVENPATVSYTGFGCGIMYNNTVTNGGGVLFMSLYNLNDASYLEKQDVESYADIRPVVVLDSNIRITGGDGETASTAWQLDLSNY